MTTLRETLRQFYPKTKQARLALTSLHCAVDQDRGGNDDFSYEALRLAALEEGYRIVKRVDGRGILVWFVNVSRKTINQRYTVHAALRASVLTLREVRALRNEVRCHGFIWGLTPEAVLKQRCRYDWIPKCLV